MKIAVFVTLIVISSNVVAAFNWKLDSLRATGDVTFFDEFDDDSVLLPPTSGLGVFLGNIDESGGYLLFSDLNGAGDSSVPVPGTLRDTVLLNDSIPDNGAGTIWSGSFIPDLADIESAPLASGYGVQINNAGNPNFSQATLAVISDGFGNAIVGLFDTGSAVDTAIISGTTGNVVLELNADPFNDQVTATYSIDGGSSFNSLSGTVAVSGELRAWAFGQATPVPIPAAWLMLVSALGALRIWFRRYCFR